jgi:hypothetical protein
MLPSLLPCGLKSGQDNLIYQDPFMAIRPIIEPSLGWKKQSSANGVNGVTAE